MKVNKKQEEEFYAAPAPMSGIIDLGSGGSKSSKTKRTKKTKEKMFILEVESYANGSLKAAPTVKERPKNIYVIEGENAAREAFKHVLKEYGFNIDEDLLSNEGAVITGKTFESEANKCLCQAIISMPNIKITLMTAGIMQIEGEKTEATTPSQHMRWQLEKQFLDRW